MNLQSEKSNNPEDENGYVFVKSHRKKRKRNKKKKVIIGILIGLLSFVVVIFGTVFVLQAIGKNSLLNYKDVNMTAPSVPDVKINENGKMVTYKGEKYKFNEDITSILFMGIDKREFGSEEYGTGGQSDVDLLVAHDTKTGVTKVISISRDTMVDINVYSGGGQFLKTQKAQLCLAYAYGDGKILSCENTVKAVSRIIYGLPINSYLSLDLDAITPLNDAIGGVDVVMQMDMKSPYGRELHKGEPATLTGDEAEKYIRERDATKLDSNNNRMARQTEYVKSFATKALQMTKQNINTPVSLFSTANNYMITNLSVDKVTYLALNSISTSGGEMEFLTVPGTVKSGEKYAEFYPDETKLYEMTLDTFYTKIS